jgi:hypothetical protein
MYYVNLIKPVRKAGRGISPRLRSRDYSVDDLLATSEQHVPGRQQKPYVMV